MERLKAVQARRAEQEAARKAAQEREAAAEAERQLAAEMENANLDDDGGGGGGGFDKLDPREVKKMNGKQLKDALKERGLGIAGQKKDLIARLLAFQA